VPVRCRDVGGGHRADLLDAINLEDRAVAVAAVQGTRSTRRDQLLGQQQPVALAGIFGVGVA
jgi:hypothetical protein